MRGRRARAGLVACSAVNQPRRGQLEAIADLVRAGADVKEVDFPTETSRSTNFYRAQGGAELGDGSWTTGVQGSGLTCGCTRAPELSKSYGCSSKAPRQTESLGASGSC